MSFIGVDLGTSFIKGAVLNLETLRLEHTRRIPFPKRLELANPLFCEFDPAEVGNVVETMIADLVLHAPDCEGIVMCSQMHGLVLVDEGGNTLSNCISWLDHRGMMPHPSDSGSYLETLIQRTTPEQRRQLGNELGLERPACFLFWLSEQKKLSPGLIPVSIPDFVCGVLCGLSPTVEITNASASGLFNLEKSDWHHEVISELGLGQLRMPEVRYAGDIIGYTKVGDRRVPCYTPVADFQCAIVGSLLSSDELSLNISTGSQVSRLTSDLTLGEYQTRPFFEGRFLNTFTGAPAGRELDLLVNTLSEFAAMQNSDTVPDPWALIAKATKELPETDLEVDLSFFAGHNANPGSISNIRQDNLKIGHLFRAAFNTMADTYYTYACQLWPEKSWRNVVFSGGLARKVEGLRESIQKKFETAYRLSPFDEDTLFGLLILASVFSGGANSISEVSQQMQSQQQILTL
jgi:sugar (pentulose or hexulose) kinase